MPTVTPSSKYSTVYNYYNSKCLMFISYIASYKLCILTAKWIANKGTSLLETTVAHSENNAQLFLRRAVCLEVNIVSQPGVKAKHSINSWIFKVVGVHCSPELYQESKVPSDAHSSYSLHSAGHGSFW